MKKGILIPAYNEEKNIERIVKLCKKYNPKAKIVVVDDGSRDKTFEKASKIKGITVLRHKKNRGKGEALKTGIKYFKKIGIDAIVIIDADGQYNPKDIPRFFEKLKQYDVVMGYRDFSKVPFRHKLGNIYWRLLFNILFGTKLKDTNCGFIGLNKNAIKKIKKIHGGYIIENSILAEAVRNQLKIGQIPVKVKYHKISSLLRGIRVVTGVAIFIIIEGIKYRFKKILNIFSK